MSRLFSGIIRASGRLGVILLLSLAFIPVSSAADAQTYSFSTIEAEGNRRIETATILTYADVPTGESVTAGELEDAYQRILDSGLFETVELEPRGATLLIRVQEFPTISVVTVEGNNRVEDEALLAVVNSQPRRVYSPSQVEADVEAIAKAYEQAGRLAATVTPKIIRRSDNRVDLIFEVSEGRVAEIERISFVGNRGFSERRLRRALQTKQAGIFRSIITRDTFIADRIEFDKQVLSDFYLSRGYVDFQVLSVNSELTRDRDAFFVTFNIREGQQFRIGEITTSSEVEEFNAEEFREAINIESGQIYNPVLIERTIARLERFAFQQNLDFLRVDPQITRNERDLTLDLDFALVRGPRIFIERIEITGNTTTLDRVVRRQFRVVEGDPFNPREIRESAERIRALGFFSSTEVDAREGSAPDQVIVDVGVREQPTGSLSFGASYSVSDGLGLTIAFSERNFLGRGQRVGASINTTDDSQTGSLSFVEPFLLGRDLSFGLALDYTTTDSGDTASYETRSASVVPSLTFPVSENGRLSLRYTLAQEEVLGVADGASDVLQREADQGRRILSAVGYTYSYDTRRVGLNPDAGVALRFSQEFAGLGGDVQYVRTTAFAGAETMAWRDDVTLRAIFEAGALKMISGNSRVTDRFLLNASKLRGFESNGVGPRDNEDALGGNLFAVVRLEADFPLGLPNEYGLRGGVFFDAGSVWQLDSDDDDVNDDFSLRAVVGFSLFWNTPLGPLRFNFSDALKSESFDEEQNFDLTISTTF